MVQRSCWRLWIITFSRLLRQSQLRNDGEHYTWWVEELKDMVARMHQHGNRRVEDFLLENDGLHARLNATDLQLLDARNSLEMTHERVELHH